MHEMHVDEDDIMSVARGMKGITSHKDIKYAIVEKDGEITVIPRDPQYGSEGGGRRRKKV